MLTIEELEKHGWEYGINKVIQGDCLEGMKLIPDNSVDLVITSPPYNAHMIYSNGKIVPRKDKVLKKYISFTDDKSPKEYFEWSCKIIDECLRVSKNQVFWNIQMLTGNKNALFKIIGYYSDTIKEIIIWDKINAEPAIQHGVMNSQFEFIIIFDKNDSIRRSFKNANFEYGTFKNVIKTNKNTDNSAKGINTACFPVRLSHILTESFTKENDLILDPFMGSWTTARACKDLNRNFIGFELEKKYCEIGEKRLEQGVMNFSI